MDKQSMVFQEQQEFEIQQSPKGLNPFGDFSCCILKKCCKKYKRGKRCKKCPDR